MRLVLLFGAVFSLMCCDQGPAAPPTQGVPAVADVPASVDIDYPEFEKRLERDVCMRAYTELLLRGYRKRLTDCRNDGAMPSDASVHKEALKACRGCAADPDFATCEARRFPLRTDVCASAIDAGP